jgi:hypothetical protein
MKGWHVEPFAYSSETQIKDSNAWPSALAINFLQQK